MASTRPKLTARQERAILALLSEPTVVRAAKAAGVSTTTIYRWLDDADFASAYHRSRRDSFSQAIGLTQRYASLAVHTLAKILNDDDAGASAKVSAAATILRFGREGLELDDLAARVDQLEAAAGKAPAPRTQLAMA